MPKEDKDLSKTIEPRELAEGEMLQEGQLPEGSRIIAVGTANLEAHDPGPGVQLGPLDAEPTERPEPNIKFVGKKRLNGELVCGDPPASVRDAYHIFEMPDPDQQKAGFFHPKAKRIIRAFPNLYQDPNNAQSGCCSDAK